MAQSFVWAHLSREAVQSLFANISNRNEFNIYLPRELFPEKTLGEDLVLSDLYFYTIKFCYENSFSLEKTSALFSIVKTTHDTSIEQFLSPDHSHGYFKDLLVRHCVQRPPYSVALYSVEEAKLITDYITDTYYRHYKLYQYMFARKRELTVTQTDLVPLSVAPKLPPLAEAQPWTEPPPPSQAADTASSGTRDMSAPLDTSAATDAGDQQKPAVDNTPVSGDGVRAVAMQAVAAELQLLRSAMEQQLKLQNDALLAKLAELEARVPAGKK
eukprot:TRINITY_DN15657_c0_g1_i1.p1 TRINITY_DN15657_c0_g1~~TRINITY_DN15657_c0_g1_i1.p1  ORF type:complete len:271 (+),score=44.44 TRINITY_DN15657_c0_g1_i1:52-864(+)